MSSKWNERWVVGSVLGGVTLLALVGCGGGASFTTAGTSAGAPTVTALTPATMEVGVATTMTVTGSNLPLTATLTIDGASCDASKANTATGFTAVCTAGAVTGSKIATIYSDAVAKGGYWIGQQTLTVAIGPGSLGVLADTGVGANQCYGAGSDALVSCSSAQALALNSKQDGMVGRDVLVPDSTDGSLGLSYSLIGPDCARDNATGLTWQRASTTLAAVAGTARNQEAAALVTAANTAILCGYTDWRLPTRHELQSLLNYGSTDPALAMDWSWFPLTKGAWYYSSSPYGTSTNVWAVDVVSGRVDSIGVATGSVEARLVR